MKFLIKRIINIVPSPELMTEKVKFSINGPSSPLIAWTQIRPTPDSDLDPKLFACKFTKYARKKILFMNLTPSINNPVACDLQCIMHQSFVSTAPSTGMGGDSDFSLFRVLV